MSSKWVRVVVSVCVLAVLAVSPGGAATGNPKWAPRDTGLRLPAQPLGAIQHVWSWTQGRRGYVLGDDSPNGYRRLDAIDADTMQPVAAAALNPPAYRAGIPAALPYGAGASHTLAVDEADGRLFVAYTGARVPQFPITPQAVDPDDPAAPCVGDHGTVFNCVGGVHVLDAASLQPLGPPVRLRSLRVGGAAFWPVLRAMTYAPPRPGTQEDGKVLLVVEDWTAAGTTGIQLAQPRLRGANVVYAVQLDPQTGEQDWAVRLDACRGARETQVGQLTQARLGDPAAILRGDSLTDPAVYVGCHTGTAQTAVVVKLALDAQGNASALPVRVNGTTVQTVAQPSATGPSAVVRQIADPARGRILMQSLHGGSETWWVFDTASFAMAGSIAVGPVGSPDAGSTPTFDARSGRLYTQGTAFVAGGPGGLFIADTAGAPPSEPLLFADGWPRGTYLSVLSTPPGVKLRPRLLAYVNGEWAVFEDYTPPNAARG